MVKPRVHETDHGIEGELTVQTYDRMQRHMRDKGLIETDDIIKSGINQGCAMELGPGPGYLGLEWLKKTQDTSLKAVDISQDMLDMARRNAKEYGMGDRTEYHHAPGNTLPFGDSKFDAVFSNGSLHEWVEPKEVLREMWRVLKPGGRLFISDLKRDTNFLIRWVMWLSIKPKEIRPGFITSLNSAYTTGELREMLENSVVTGFVVKANPFGLKVTAQKQ